MIPWQEIENKKAADGKGCKILALGTKAFCSGSQKGLKWKYSVV